MESDFKHTQCRRVFCFEHLWFWGSGAGGSWWALKELTGDRCELVCETEKGQAGLKFLLANTNARVQLGANLSTVWMTRGLLQEKDQKSGKTKNVHGKQLVCSALCFVFCEGLIFQQDLSQVPVPNSPNMSKRIYTDMIERDQTSLRQTTLYDCGFPCQPFSLLNSSSQFMNAPEAECFRQSIRTIWACQPLIAVLENVMGLARKGVWRIVEKYLMKLTTYFFCRLHITPDKLGSCVSRRRIYILLLHRPVNSFSIF